MVVCGERRAMLTVSLLGALAVARPAVMMMAMEDTHI